MHRRAVLTFLMAFVSAPLALRAQAAPDSTMERVALAAHDIERGTVLAAGDIEYVMRPRVIPLRRGAKPAPEVAAGWVARAVIVHGSTLRSPLVEAPRVIDINAPVDATWTDGVVAITVHGVATTSAALGEHVTLRTSDGRHIDAVAVGAGRAIIDPRD